MNATKIDSQCAGAQTPETIAVNPSDLYALRDTLALCAFGAEALRVLNELEWACHISPDLDKKLNQLIEARREWVNLPAPIDQVLTRATQQLDVLLGAS